MRLFLHHCHEGILVLSKISLPGEALLLYGQGVVGIGDFRIGGQVLLRRSLKSLFYYFLHIAEL